jgi:hypothetical protein
MTVKKKVAAKKKTTTKKTATPKKKASVKKKTVQKKAAPKKKVAAKKKTTTTKKAAPKAKAAPVLENTTAEVVVDTSAMPSVPKLKHLLRAAARGDALPEEQADLADLARELSWTHCHFCGKKSDASMRKSSWDGVILCPCLGQKKARRSKPATPTSSASAARAELQPELSGWSEARKEPDGGLTWLLTKMGAGEVHPGEPVYSGTCRCGTGFTIYAGMIARVTEAYKLTEHRPSTKCRECKAAPRQGHGVKPAGWPPALQEVAS